MSLADPHLRQLNVLFELLHVHFTIIWITFAILSNYMGVSFFLFSVFEVGNNEIQGK